MDVHFSPDELSVVISALRFSRRSLNSFVRRGEGPDHKLAWAERSLATTDALLARLDDPQEDNA